MKKILSHAIVGLLFLFVGTWYGYDRGVKNQLFFDAPAKLHLYNAYLEQGNPADYLESEIMYQLGLLEGMKDEVSPILLNHPIHVGMEDIYEEYRPKVEALPQIKKARNEIKAYNKPRNEMDGSVEPPIR